LQSKLTYKWCSLDS